MRRFECDKCGEVVGEDQELFCFCLTHNAMASAWDKDKHHKGCHVVDLCRNCLWKVCEVRTKILKENNRKVIEWFNKKKEKVVDSPRKLAALVLAKKAKKK